MFGVTEAFVKTVTDPSDRLRTVLDSITHAASVLKVVDCESTRVQETSGPKNDPVLGDIVETVTIRYRREER